MAWSKIKVGDVTPGPRYNFSSFVKGKPQHFFVNYFLKLCLENKIYLFGGVGKGEYASGIISVLNCDENQCKKIIQESKNMGRPVLRLMNSMDNIFEISGTGSGAGSKNQLIEGIGGNGLQQTQSRLKTQISLLNIGTTKGKKLIQRVFN